MGPKLMARLLAGRVHYAWIVVAVMFVVIIASVGVRATPGVLIVPLQQAFGWNAAVISGAISLNILLFGLVGPFAAGMIQVIGLKPTILFSMALLVIGAGLSSFVTQIWQLYLTWGVLVGLGSGAGMAGLATAVANRWFVQRRGLVVGLLTASNASGQLVFLPDAGFALVYPHHAHHRVFHAGEQRFAHDGNGVLVNDVAIRVAENFLLVAKNVFAQRPITIQDVRPAGNFENKIRRRVFLIEGIKDHGVSLVLRSGRR